MKINQWLMKGVVIVFLGMGSGLTLYAENVEKTTESPKNIDSHSAFKGYSSYVVSVFGPELARYKENEPFYYVNSDAPKGGTLRLSQIGSFTTLNPFKVGESSVPWASLMVYETLAISSYDPQENGVAYGLLGKKFILSDDLSSLTVELDPTAYFSDGTPVTAEDVVFSYELIFHPDFLPYYRVSLEDVKSVEKIDKRTVRFHFKRWSRDLPLNVVTMLPIMAKHHYGRVGKNFAKDFSDWDKKSGLPCPLMGSGPYLLEDFDYSQQATWKRNPNYWAINHPKMKGCFNYDKVVFRIFQEPFGERTSLFADEIDAVEVTSSRDWHFEYDPASNENIRLGYITKEPYKNESMPYSQCFVFNVRRDVFKDLTIRKVVVSLLDFDYMNTNFFYHQYLRQKQLFDNIPALYCQAFSNSKMFDYLLNLQQKYNQPKEGVYYVPDDAIVLGPSNLDVDLLGNSIPIEHRIMLANRYLDESGWHYDRVSGCRKKNNIELKFEVLLDSDSFIRIVNPMFEVLRQVGFRVAYKSVQLPEYMERQKKFDYDMIVDMFPTTTALGIENFNYWHSSTAHQPGSTNYCGVANPAVDEILTQMMESNSLNDLYFYAQALDRIICSQHYIMFQWYSSVNRAAYWNRFSHPKKINGTLQTHVNMLFWWWYDQEKANVLEQAKKSRSSIIPLQSQNPSR